MIERFEVAGTASEELMAISEAYYRPDMPAEELKSKLHQILTSACDRDMYSGWGGIIYMMTQDGIETTFLKTK